MTHKSERGGVGKERKDVRSTEEQRLKEKERHKMKNVFHFLTLNHKTKGEFLFLRTNSQNI